MLIDVRNVVDYLRIYMHNVIDHLTANSTTCVCSLCYKLEA